MEWNIGKMYEEKKKSTYMLEITGECWGPHNYINPLWNNIRFYYNIYWRQCHEEMDAEGYLGRLHKKLKFL